MNVGDNDYRTLDRATALAVVEGVLTPHEWARSSLPSRPTKAQLVDWLAEHHPRLLMDAEHDYTLRKALGKRAKGLAGLDLVTKAMECGVLKRAS